MELITQIALEALNNIFLVYGVVLFSFYILIGIFSSFQVSFYIRKNQHFRYHTMAGYKHLPSVSIIAPCFNEEKNIIDNIRSLLLLSYPKADVIVVNDGSRDRSLEIAIEHYDLVKVDLSWEATIPTATIRGIYKSRNIAYSNLIVIDKENGGKADALNAGINISRSDLFLAVDVDCVIEHDAIYKMVKPFLEEEKGKQVIASGGTVRVANSCHIENGQLVKAVFPKNMWARFQVLEYFRAFTMSRMAWSKLNGILIISGAFGMFDRRIAMAVGGYDTTTVGEDFELVVRMRKHMHKVEKKKYQVAFIPDPLCWTEVPSSLKILSRQRNRWTRGSVDTVLKHRDLFFNPKYGIVGLLSYPFWVLFEWLAPIIEFIGLLYFTVMLILGKVNLPIFLFLLAVVFLFSLALTAIAVFYESYFFARYKGFTYLVKVVYTAVLELFVSHPLNVYFAISGNIDFFFRKKKKSWGNMTREGLGVQKSKE